jgi:hypothetical protein
MNAPQDRDAAAGRDPAVALASMDYLLSGRLEREVCELRDHLAALQRDMPAGQQQKIVAEFGQLLEGS